MKTTKSTEKEQSNEASNKDSTQSKTVKGRASSGLNASQTIQLAKGAIDIGKNITSLLVEKERTKQTEMECDRDIAVSNNEVGKVRLDMEDRRSQRLKEQDEREKDYDLVLRELKNKEALQDDYLMHREKILSDVREGRISSEEFQVYMDRLEKGLFE